MTNITAVSAALNSYATILTAGSAQPTGIPASNKSSRPIPSTGSPSPNLISNATSAAIAALGNSLISSEENSSDHSAGSGQLSDAKTALTSLEQTATQSKSSEMSAAEKSLQQLLEMYLKLAVLGDVKAIAALAKQIGSEAKKLGESISLPNGGNAAASASPSGQTQGGASSLEASSSVPQDAAATPGIDASTSGLGLNGVAPATNGIVNPTESPTAYAAATPTWLDSGTLMSGPQATDNNGSSDDPAQVQAKVLLELAKNALIQIENMLRAKQREQQDHHTPDAALGSLISGVSREVASV